MKTSELPIGTHVAYDSNQSRNYHHYTQAFVIAIRPRGNKSSYWGKNGNHNTIGIAYTQHYWKDADGRPVWQAAWVRPQDIHMPWDEYSAAIKRADENTKRQQQEQKRAQADRTKRFAALPVGVQNLVTDWRVEDLIKRGSVTMNISVDWLEKLVKAAQADTPAAIQAEVDAALALLQ